MNAYQYSTADAYQEGYPAGGHYGENGAEHHQYPHPENSGGSSVGSASDVGTSTSSSSGGSGGSGSTSSSFDDPRIADLPRILLMGPRRGGKTSIQVSWCDEMRGVWCVREKYRYLEAS